MDLPAKEKQIHQKMSRGHLYIAFGKQYDLAAAYSARYLRRCSDLPIHVVTNIHRKRRCPLWQEVGDLSIEFIDKPDSFNREVKTNPMHFTPFYLTLYTDCDTLIHNVGFDEAFEILRYCDVAFPVEIVFPVQGKITKLYKEAMAQFELRYPLVVYHGGVCAFKRSSKARMFFNKWNQFWREFGMRRDMPPLAAVAQRYGSIAVVANLPSHFGARDGQVIQHIAGDVQSLHMPKIRKSKKFDKKGQWKWLPM